MGSFLGTNDAKKVIATITPPKGAFGIAFAGAVLGLIPGNGFKFPFQVDAKSGGTYATAQRSVALNTYTAGSDGKVVKNVSHDKSGTFVLTIMQKSITSTLFNALLRAQELGFDFLFDCNIVDLTDGVKYTGRQCSLQGYPTRAFASDAAATLEYTILVAEMSINEAAFTGF